MRTSTIWQLLGTLTLTLALAFAIAAGLGSSHAQAQVDCERVEYNDRIVVRCDTSGVDTDGNGSGTSTDNQGDGDRDPDGDDGNAEDGDEADGEDDAGDDDSNDADADESGEESDGAESGGDESGAAEFDEQSLDLVQAFLEDEDAVAVNGVFEFDEGDRGGRRGIDDRRERAIAAAEAQAQLEADAQAAADAAAQAAAEAQAQVDEAQAQAEAAEEEAQAEADAAAEAADDPGGDGDETSEVASGASPGGIDDSGRSLWWLIVALGLLALAFVGVLVARRRSETYYDEDDESFDRAPSPSVTQGPPEGWASPVAGSSVAGAAPQEVSTVNTPPAEVPVEHLPIEQVPVAEPPQPGPLANLFPPLPADHDALVENPSGTENPAHIEVPVADAPDAEVEQASELAVDAAMTETVRMDRMPIEQDPMAMPSDDEVAEIEVPIETVSLEDLPPPPPAPDAGQSALPVRQARDLPSRQARDLPTRDPGSQLSAGAAAAAAAAEGRPDFHRLPDSLSAMPTADLGPAPVLPELDLDEITQERLGE